MKLVGEIQYDREKKDFLRNIYYTDISFSLQDVTKEEVEQLCETIKSEVYTFGTLGYHNIIERARNIFLNKEHSFSSLIGKNRVKLDYYEKGGHVNIFIHGPKAEEIEARLIELASKNDLENLALSQGE